MFRSPEAAELSRDAVSAFMGLAMDHGVLAATTDHYDRTPATAGRVPMAPRKGGGKVQAPDVVLINLTYGMVVGVEVEARGKLDHYPGATFVEVAKLNEHVEVELTGVHYARVRKEEDFDVASSWGQRAIRALQEALQRGEIDFVPSGRARLLLLREKDLAPLEDLMKLLRDGPR